MWPPADVYFSALLIIFTKTCCIRPASATTAGIDSGSLYSRKTPCFLAVSVRVITASDTSATISQDSILYLRFPLCILEKSRRSSTMTESRSASLIITSIPFLVMVGSSMEESTVSPHPLMAVRGVRSSWDTEEINSFFIFSVEPSSLAI